MSREHNTVPPCPHGRGLACTTCYPVNLLPQIRTTRKPAKDVVPGEKVWSQGYRWLVQHVMVEPERTVLYCVAADLPGRAPAPEGYRDSMSLAYLHGTDAVMDVDNLDNAIARKDSG